MRRISVLIIIVLIALASFAPAYAKDKERGRPRRVQLKPLEMTGYFYRIDFTEETKIKEVLVNCSCGHYRISLFEQPANKCFSTIWLVAGSDIGSYGYVLLIRPYKKISVFARR